MVSLGLGFLQKSQLSLSQLVPLLSMSAFSKHLIRKMIHMFESFKLLVCYFHHLKLPSYFSLLLQNPSPQSKHPELVNEEKEENSNTSDYGYFSVMAVFTLKFQSICSLLFCNHLMSFKDQILVTAIFFSYLSLVKYFSGTNYHQTWEHNSIKNYFLKMQHKLKKIFFKRFRVW